ncbi:hypothetical protein OIU74_006289 [Salix koriyanagi]|uniref:Uncharacterized protein n=1 Tax=Salix koriyanagi TaxID=2511006 RepID=A0A9Q0UDR9_9ROSI|nr:hypothetical protein OIU74_006289 [Salix koriyanagi]
MFMVLPPLCSWWWYPPLLWKAFSFSTSKVRNDGVSHSNSKEEERTAATTKEIWDGGSNPQCQGSSFFFSFQVRDDRGSHSNSKEEERTTATTQEIGMVAATPNAKEVLSSSPSKLGMIEVLTPTPKKRKGQRQQPRK